MDYLMQPLVPPLSVQLRTDKDITILETLLKMSREKIYVATATTRCEDGLNYFSLLGFNSLFLCDLFDMWEDLPLN